MAAPLLTRRSITVTAGRDSWRWRKTNGSTRTFVSPSSVRLSNHRQRASVRWLPSHTQSAVPQEFHSLLQDDFSKSHIRTWMWSLLGVSMCGGIAAAVVMEGGSSALAEEAAAAVNRGEGDGERNSHITKPPGHESGKLRKRKTAGKEKFTISTAAVRGDRSHMEDTSFVSDCKRFTAVYDGHGGAGVAQYLRSQLFKLIAPELQRLDASPEYDDDDSVNAKKKRHEIKRILRDAMHQVDTEVLAKPEWKYQGSTAVGVLLYDDVIYSLNVGDSRAVLSRGGECIELTRDHKPNDSEERARIESLGGSVNWHGYVDANGDPIEPYGAYRVNGNLAVARAIGDRDSRPFVTGEVEIKLFDRDFVKDEFIIVASDGLWDVFTSEEVVTFVQDVLSGEVGGRESWRSGGHSDTSVPIFEWSHQYKSDRSLIKAARTRRKAQIANYLVQEALFRGTSDNVSVIVVWLR